MTKERKATSDLQLSDDMSHVGELPRGLDFLETNAHLVMGESQGYDLCLLPLFWHVGGGRQGKWRVDEVLMCQTTFFMLPQDQRGKMQDNEFIGNRQDPTEWVGDFQIVERSDRIIWQVGNMKYVCRPPYWEIKGEHMGVTCDLTLGGMGKADWTFGPWSNLPTTSRAGFDQRCWVEGTITVGGREFTLENGYGGHEILTLGETWDHMKAIGQAPYYWISGISESIQIFLFAMPGAGLGYGRIYVEGREIPFGQGEVVVDDLELWTDPKTGMQVPIRWHVNMNAAGGIADMDIVAGGRGLFCVLTRSGYTIRYPFLSRTNGRIFLPEGLQVPIDDMMIYVEWGRSAMPLEGGADL